MKLCFAALQLGELGPSITKVLLDRDDKFIRETLDYDTEAEAWAAMPKRLGIKDDKEGAVYFGARPTNVEIHQHIEGVSLVCVNFSRDFPQGGLAIVMGGHNYCLRVFSLALALAHSPCPLAGKCLQPRDGKFTGPMCDNPCMASEIVQVRNFIQFWVDPYYLGIRSPDSNSDALTNGHRHLWLNEEDA